MRDNNKEPNPPKPEEPILERKPAPQGDTDKTSTLPVTPVRELMALRTLRLKTSHAAEMTAQRLSPWRQIRVPAYVFGSDQIVSGHPTRSGSSVTSLDDVAIKAEADNDSPSSVEMELDKNGDILHHSTETAE